MRRDAAIATIVDLCRKGAGFHLDAAALVAKIAAPDRPALVESLLECGVIPESFGHDSTEEKLYAKYCDVLLEKAFAAMGLKSAVIEERADSADVLGESAEYSIVGDAKAFRLSRTAKNQKDFKVTALSGWRGDHTYALLVCPIYQYPRKRSQIYEQATEHGVSLIGYVHLSFLVEHSPNCNANLPAIWNVAASIGQTNQASAYWRTVDEAVCQAVNRTGDDLAAFKRREQDTLEAIKNVEIAHLQGEIEKVMKLSKEEAIQQLIFKLNTPSRIEKIKGVTY